MRDFYYILGVDENASPDQIKSAFRKLSMKFHPDKNNGEKFYEDQFKAILEAWDTLSDPIKKARYDEQLKRYRSAAANIAYKDALIRKYEEELKRRGGATHVPYQPPVQPTAQPASQPYNIPRRMVIITGAIMLLFFVSLYLFAPREKRPIVSYQEVKLPDTIARKLFTTNNEAPVLPADPSLVLDGQTSTLKQFLNNEEHLRSNYSVTDIDNDGMPELLLSYHTGGAHCCNVDHLFVFGEDGRFDLVFSYTGGLYASGNKLSLYYYQDIGYYHSCYNCTITEKLPRQDVNAEINIIFDKGKLTPAPTSAPLNESIVTNLAYLSSRGIPALDEEGWDDGSRKEIMLHMIAYHFNNRDITATKALFDQYYSWNDRADRWKDLLELMRKYEEIIFSNAAYREKRTF